MMPEGLPYMPDGSYIDGRCCGVQLIRTRVRDRHQQQPISIAIAAEAQAHAVIL